MACEQIVIPDDQLDKPDRLHYFIKTFWLWKYKKAIIKRRFKKNDQRMLGIQCFRVFVILENIAYGTSYYEDVISRYAGPAVIPRCALCEER